MTIDQVIASVPRWRGQSVAVEPLAGGLTNTNYKVTAGRETVVVRIPGKETHLLAIDRDNEQHNARAAAETGVAPRVLEILDRQIALLEFLPGRTMTNQTLQEPGMPTRIAQSLRRLHRARPFASDFNMFRLIERYLDVCRSENAVLPNDYHQERDKVERIESAFARAPVQAVPCHNDLLAGNYIDDGTTLWLIDFEYSGNNDPCFEVGNTAQELNYDDPRLEELGRAYFDSWDDGWRARVKLSMILSDVGWTLWGAIQQRISDIPFDFWGWAMEKWTRGKRNLEDPSFQRLLAQTR